MAITPSLQSMLHEYAPNTGQINMSVGGLTALNLPSTGAVLMNMNPTTPTAFKFPGGDKVSAIPVQITKEWQKTFVQNFRHSLVHVLMQSFASMPDVSTLPPAELFELIEEAKEAELEMFTTANSRSEYYHLLAEKTLMK